MHKVRTYMDSEGKEFGFMSKLQKQKMEKTKQKSNSLKEFKKWYEKDKARKDEEIAEAFKSWHSLGYVSGRIDELKLYTPFRSVRWWTTFLLGIAWGLIIANLLIMILK